MAFFQYIRKSSGHWTMVYDEGFEVKHGGYIFFAFSKYLPSKNGYDSYCGETLVGWYNIKETEERGCYRATKVGYEQKASEQAQNGHVVQPKMLEFEIEGPQNPLTMNEQDMLVDQINNDPNIKWKARSYSKWNGMNLNEINQLAGRRKFYQLAQDHPSFSADQIDSETDSSNYLTSQISSLLKVNTKHDIYRNFALKDVSDLPESFSWEKFLPPVREQKDCGSCYAISTMSMLSARLQIQGHNVNLSPQISIDCNYYNQGCDGGYPYLVEKFFTEFYAVPEESYPYKAKNEECKYKVLDKQHNVYGVKSYKFIGGAYGKSNERSIMSEIYKNGPVIMNFEPSFDFMFYAGGIYHSTQAADWILHHKKRPEWEKVDHSVLCYGWGVEDGEKYWLLQNSWGTEWGESGRFRQNDYHRILNLKRMRRGTDESAIESMAEAAIPTVIEQKESKKSKKLQKTSKQHKKSQKEK